MRFTEVPMKHQYTTFFWLFTNFTHGNMLIACNAGDRGLIPVSERSLGEGNGNPLQYSCLENPMDTGAWWAIVPGVARVGHDLQTKPPAL